MLFIASPVYAGCHPTYTASMVRVAPILACAQMSFQYAFTIGQSILPHARNSLVYDFMQTDCTHLLFIDSDIEFRAEDILTMIDADKDVLCGPAPRRQIHWERVAAAAASHVPAADLHKHTGTVVIATLDGKSSGEAQLNEPFEIASGGTGFMLIKRQVFNSLARPGEVPTYRIGDKLFHQYFDTAIVDGVLISEDVHFCQIARAHGYRIWAAPWVTLRHAGSYMFNNF